MQTHSSFSFNVLTIRTMLINASALALVVFTPALSHLFNLPIYLIEPMRLMLILALAHTNRNNAYLLALTLPLFSFLVSGHPIPLKMALMSAELVLNVWFFHFLLTYLNREYKALFFSIILSKAVYYLLKYILISIGLISLGLVMTPLWLQLIMTIVFSGYFYLLYRPKAA